MTAIPTDDNWLSQGRFGGAVVSAAHERLSSIGSDAPLCLDILDVVQADEKLIFGLSIRALLQDVRVGRFSVEMAEENMAIAAQTADAFEANWPKMRTRLREALLIAHASSASDYCMAVLIEFSDQLTPSVSPVGGPPTAAQWLSADRLYRGALKTHQSTALAWEALIHKSSLPPCAREAVSEWCRLFGRTVDQMMLVRNCIVHRTSRADEKTARALRIGQDERLQLTDAMCTGFRRACIGFACAVEPLCL